MLIDEQDRWLYLREASILECTEAILGEMHEQGVTLAVLADRLGKSPRYLNKLLDGRKRRMTIREVSDILCALNRRMVLTTAVGDTP
jgi:hypothetical protein